MEVPFRNLHTFIAISIVNTNVNILFATSNIFRSFDHGGILGRSIAKVMQLLAMKTKIIKSNQACSVKELHRNRNLKYI